MEKRIKKIYKQEIKALKLLESQEDDLQKAVVENEKLIEMNLLRESKEERKLRQEIEELTNKQEKLNSKLTKVGEQDCCKQ